MASQHLSKDDPFIMDSETTQLPPVDMQIRQESSALLRAAEYGTSRLCAVFSGQGTSNSLILAELTELVQSHRELVSELLDSVTPLLKRLSSSPEAQGYYKDTVFDVQAWIKDSSTAPMGDRLLEAPLSFPLIGLLNLAQFFVVCRYSGHTPGDFVSRFQCLTGHSQGLAVATCIASATSWSEFLIRAQLVVELLFWIGHDSHCTAQRAFGCADNARAHSSAHEHALSHLLSVRGLSKDILNSLILEANDRIPDNHHIYLALTNGQDNHVVASSQKSLSYFEKTLQNRFGNPDADQTRIPFSQRKPSVQTQFLPVTAPFHTPHLRVAAQSVKRRFEDRTFSSSGLRVPVLHTNTGGNLQETSEQAILNVLIDAITCEAVEWPSIVQNFDSTHVVAFGTTDLADLLLKSVEGTGCRVIFAGSNSKPRRHIGSRSELFATSLPFSTLHPLSWRDQFQPRLITSASGEINLETKLSRLLGTPPIITGGMTPTTVHPDFVAAVMNAGYHIELAGGGYIDSKSMSKAIRDVVAQVSLGRAVSCNLIYVNPRAISWQIPMIQRLIREGVPIEGLTIGAGVPSPDIAKEYIAALGLKHIAFKPGSQESIQQVLAIAKAHPNFPIILQWTGGRGGGHHSYEDFHAPILALYASIRRCENIILVAGSGFGDASSAYPYLSGAWSLEFGRPSMPFDGILLGSRMMMAQEAHTSEQVRELISNASGVQDQEWEKTYHGAAGGVITVQSEMGQPIHKIATRGVLLWAELDKTIFSLPREKQAAALLKQKPELIRRLNEDFAKPWFGQTSSGQPVDIDSMSYAEVLERLVSLMFVKHQEKWIDLSYIAIVSDFVHRVAARLIEDMDTSQVDDLVTNSPLLFMSEFNSKHDKELSELIHPEDEAWFYARCKTKKQKPVPFVPCLDADFEHWFKKDSLWQAEDIDAVVGQDAGRVCILHGPVAAQHSINKVETAREILDGIYKELVLLVQRNLSPGGTPVSEIDSLWSPTQDSGVQCTPASEVNSELFAQTMSAELEDKLCKVRSSVNFGDSWFNTLKSARFILQDRTRQANPIRRILDLPGVRILKPSKEGLDFVIELEHSNGDVSRVLLQCFDGLAITVHLEYPKAPSPVSLPLHFNLSHNQTSLIIEEVMEGRNVRIKSFYRELWLNGEKASDDNQIAVYKSQKAKLTEEMLNSMRDVIETSVPGQRCSNDLAQVFPINSAIVFVWELLVRPLLLNSIDGDILNLVHQSNSFAYHANATPLRVGDEVTGTSRLLEVRITDVGKEVTVEAEISRQEAPVLVITSKFLYKGQYTDFESTMCLSNEDDRVVAIQTKQDEAVLKDQKWLNITETEIPLGAQVLFRLQTRASWKDRATYRRLSVNGPVYRKDIDAKLQQIGNVSFTAEDCVGNPVMDYLQRRGSDMSKIAVLEQPGWSGTSTYTLTVPRDNQRYASVSHDINPIHSSPIFAAWAGLPGTITHGMFTSAVTGAVLEKLVTDGTAPRIRKFSTSFVGMVLPGDELIISIEHFAMRDGNMCFKLSAKQSVTGETVLEGEAEVEQTDTVYVFTGQGSQSKGMGMDLYESSEVAKRMWDDIDGYLMETYGKSITAIVWWYLLSTLQAGPS